MPCDIEGSARAQRSLKINVGVENVACALEWSGGHCSAGMNHHSPTVVDPFIRAVQGLAVLNYCGHVLR